MAQMNSIFNSFNFCLEEDRLETFKKWPFANDAPCSAIKMAEAGFYQPNPLEEHDLVKCFICSKELDGWEINDDPWKEHEHHQTSCPFVLKRKPEADLKYEDLLDLLQASVLLSMDKIHEANHQKLLNGFEELNKTLVKKWKKKK